MQIYAVFKWTNLHAHPNIQTPTTRSARHVTRVVRWYDTLQCRCQSHLPCPTALLYLHSVWFYDTRNWAKWDTLSAQISPQADSQTHCQRWSFWSPVHYRRQTLFYTSTSRPSAETRGSCLCMCKRMLLWNKNILNVPLWTELYWITWPNLELRWMSFHRGNRLFGHVGDWRCPVDIYDNPPVILHQSGFHMIQEGTE